MKSIVLLLMLFVLSVQANTPRGLQLKKMKEEQRVALVIGNTNYKNLAHLNNPINDARLMKNVLKQRGFEVIYKENATKRDMKKLLKKFSHKLSRGGIGLYYFAGHGVNVDGKNYLVGTNSVMDDKDEVEFETLALNLVTKKMKNAGNRLNIIILDACRNDPFSRGGGGGLAPVSNAKGIFIAYATEAGSVASDGRGGKNGVFTKYLVKNLQESGATIETVFKNTRADVYDATNGKQSPGVYNQIRGDFFFTLPTKNQTSNSYKPKKVSSFSFKNEAPTTFSITINPTPSDARISITNIKPRYYDGIRLKKSTYNIKVSKSGYITKKGKIDLESDFSADIVLEKVKSVYKKPTYSRKNKNGWDKSIYRGKRSYSKNSSHTVKDNLTGLIWQKTGSSSQMKWSDAKGYCSSLSKDGYNNWRLPTIKELRYLADRTKYNPTIDTNYFNSESSWYWSSTTYKGNSSRAWILYFYDGDDNYSNKSNGRYVLCVVGRQ